MTFGRPPSFFLSHIDCKMPHTGDSSDEQSCEFIRLSARRVDYVLTFTGDSQCMETSLLVRMSVCHPRPSIWCQESHVHNRTAARPQTARFPSPACASGSRFRQFRTTGRRVPRNCHVDDAATYRVGDTRNECVVCV